MIDKVKFPKDNKNMQLNNNSKKNPNFEVTT